MIQNDQEYRTSVKMFKAWRERCAQVKQQLLSEGMSAEEIKRLRDPGKSFYLGIEDEIKEYEQRTGIQPEESTP